MPASSVVEVADRLSRKRPVGVAVAAIYFLAIQPFVYPGFGRTGAAARGHGWAVNAFVLLLLLLPAAGFARGRRVRELLNDEVALLHARLAMAIGFWVAMSSALVMYVLPVSATLSGREALYLVVTPATGVALLVFAWLEWRAHRDV